MGTTLQEPAWWFLCASECAQEPPSSYPPCGRDMRSTVHAAAGEAPGEKTNNEQTGPRPSIHSVYSNVLYVLGSVPHTLNPTPYYLLARGEAWGSLMPYGIHLYVG